MNAKSGPETSALPDGVRLLHIGPHKTGTTTVQAAFHQNRERLEGLGVHYAGQRAHPMTAAIGASTNRRLPSNSSDAGAEAWTALLAEIRASTARAVVLSSEFFCEADDARARAIAEVLDPSRVHVVITLRPLVNIVGSQWQQYIQNRAVIGYADWLESMFSMPAKPVTPTFWQRHRHDELVRRWADIVGPERVTVIVLDETDPGMLLSSFEGLVAVPHGTLVAHDVTANRSLTAAEVELLRRFNGEYVAERWSAADYTELIRFGAARHLQERRPTPGEAALTTPQWAIERGLEIGAGIAARIEGSGVNVVGSLEALASPQRRPLEGDVPVLEEIPATVAASFLAGIVIELGTVRGLPLADLRVQGPIEAAVRERHRRRRIATHIERTEQDIARLRAQLGAGPPSPARLLRGRLLGLVRDRLRPR